MAPRFATVSKDKILEVNEAAAPVKPKGRQNLACRRLLVGRKNFLNEYTTKLSKMIPEPLSIMQHKQTLTK